MGTDGVILYANARFAAMARTMLRDVLGAAVSTFFREPLPESGATEGSLIRLDGSDMPCRLSTAPLQLDGTEGTGVVVTDVTEIVYAREALRHSNEELQEQFLRANEANRMKTAFLANMSHELRTPLNSIIGFADLIHSGMAGPVDEKHREYLEYVLKSSRHLLRLIDDVLDMAKIESGKLQLRLEPSTRDIQVVALSALATLEDREQALAAGCDAYLSKPFQASDLLDTVRRCLDPAPEESPPAS